ncbi:hypothetical protein HDU92_004164 [Lobulomyces angularis]|nr:hypothetical protein HDU92_004164 [Lobulomyces angularis]
MGKNVNAIAVMVLKLACNLGSCDCIERLVNEGLDVGLFIEEALDEAIKGGNLDAVRMLSFLDDRPSIAETITVVAKSFQKNFEISQFFLQDERITNMHGGDLLITSSERGDVLLFKNLLFQKLNEFNFDNQFIVFNFNDQLISWQTVFVSLVEGEEEDLVRLFLCEEKFVFNLLTEIQPELPHVQRI